MECIDIYGEPNVAQFPKSSGLNELLTMIVIKRRISSVEKSYFTGGGSCRGILANPTAPKAVMRSSKASQSRSHASYK